MHSYSYIYIYIFALKYSQLPRPPVFLEVLPLPLPLCGLNIYFQILVIIIIYSPLPLCASVGAIWRPALHTALQAPAILPVGLLLFFFVCLRFSILTNQQRDGALSVLLLELFLEYTSSLHPDTLYIKEQIFLLT